MFVAPPPVLLRFPRALVLARTDDVEFYGDEEGDESSDGSVALDSDDTASDMAGSISDDASVEDEGELVGE